MEKVIFKSQFQLVNYRENNDLIAAINPDMSPIAQKIICITLLLSNKMSEINQTIKIPANNLKKLLGFSATYPNFVDYIKKINETELMRCIYFDENEKIIKREDIEKYTNDKETVLMVSGWFSYIKYDKRGVFEFTINPYIAHSYFNYKKNFTIYNYVIDSYLTKNKHANILYKAIKSNEYKYKNKTQWSIKVGLTQLKELFGIKKDKYKNYANFRIKILNDSINLINKYTPFFISIKEEYIIRKVENIIINVKRKNKEEEEDMWDNLKKDIDIDSALGILLSLEKLNNTQILYRYNKTTKESVSEDESQNKAEVEENWISISDII